MGLSQDKIMEHYAKKEVKEEIALFCRKRWVAIFGKAVLRYDERGYPLRIERPSQVTELLNWFSDFQPRSIYATSALYRSLSHKKLVEEAILYTPYWDVDNDPKKWRATVEAVHKILDVLELEGVLSSTYIMWTGRGMHVNLNEGSISSQVISKYGALDSAWALVEYVRGKILGWLHEIRIKHEAPELRVDNELKPKCLLSVPLSLHRKVDSVIICLSPDELCEFDPCWSNPNSFRHNKGWKKFTPGEADSLIKKAIEIYGGYPYTRRRYRRREPRVEDMIRKWIEREG